MFSVVYSNFYSFFYNIFFHFDVRGGLKGIRWLMKFYLLLNFYQFVSYFVF